MYMKVFARGTGSGSGPVDYVIGEKLDRAEQPPEVLCGDPDMTKALIDGIDRKWKYTSGVLSWAPGEEVTPDQEQAVMDDFEKVAFAGLDPDQRDILWVRHTHANHHELHFIIPRLELSTGKSFNPCPPGWQKDFDVFRDLHNHREGWSRPDDPLRAREFHPGFLAQVKDKEDIRETITDFIRQRIEGGMIKSRVDIIAALHEVGLKTPRIGKEYLTVHIPENDQRVRLKGGIYAKAWRADRTPEITDGQGPGGDRDAEPGKIRELGKQLQSVCRKRADYNRNLFPRPVPEFGPAFGRGDNSADEKDDEDKPRKKSYMDESPIPYDHSLDAYLGVTPTFELPSAK